MQIVVCFNKVLMGLRNPQVAEQVGYHLGTFLGVIQPKRDSHQNFVRVRVRIHITQALRRRTYLRTEDGVRH